MPHREPTVRSRELGDGLRQAMQDAGLTGKQAARMLDWSPSFVSMLLSGKRGPARLMGPAVSGQLSWWLSHAVCCRFRNSSWTSCGVL
ncbi:MAG: helix-turn-helix domain-containing protein [Pseudonocardiaceae bacterium]